MKNISSTASDYATNYILKSYKELVVLYMSILSKFSDLFLKGEYLVLVYRHSRGRIRQVIICISHQTAINSIAKYTHSHSDVPQMISHNEETHCGIYGQSISVQNHDKAVV